MALEQFPALRTHKYPDFSEELTFLHAEEILDMYLDLLRKQRETRAAMPLPGSACWRHRHRSVFSARMGLGD